MNKRKKLAIAVGVLTRQDGSVLMAKRPKDKSYAGFWEFPGGKVNKNELLVTALARELKEELDVKIEGAIPWLTRRFNLGDVELILNFFKVYQWQGEPTAIEGQDLVWQDPGEITVSPVLPANKRVLEFLKLPLIYGITNASSLGKIHFSKVFAQAIKQGLNFIQIRDKTLSYNAREDLVAEIVKKSKEIGGISIVNEDFNLAKKYKADGVHLPSALLSKIKERPDFRWVGASCHDGEEMQKALELDLDFVVLGSVFATPTHPNRSPIGWDGFEKMVKNFPIPVYAIGGLTSSMLQAAQSRGAHGICMLRGVWDGKIS